MKKTLAIALATAAGLFAAGAANAGSNVFWSIGISAPPVATVISNGPGYYAPAPVYYEPAPVYAPAPAYSYPPRVVYSQPRAYYPPQVVYERPATVYYQGGRRYADRDHDGIPDRWDHYDNRQRHHGHYRDRDRDGIPDRYDHRDNRRYGY